MIFRKGVGASLPPIDIACARDTSTQEILSCDLIATSTIFKENSPKKPDKASLVLELEKKLSPLTTYSILFPLYILQSYIIVDFIVTIKIVAVCVIYVALVTSSWQF